MKHQNQNFINRLNKIQQLSQQEHITPQILDQIISSEQQQQLKAKEAINKKYNPIMNTEETIRLYTRQVSTYDLFFNAPSVDVAVQPYTLKQIHSILLKNFTGTAIMGSQLKINPQMNQSGKSLDEKLKQRNEINTQLVAKIFMQNKYTMNQLVIYEQMMQCFAPEQLKYTMNISRYGFPVPPIDIRMPIICLYQIINMNDQLPVFIFPYLLNNRLVDMIEQIFWLVHCIIFHDQETQIPFDQCSNVQQEEMLDIEAIPDYLSPKHKNHTVQSYLQARIADAYAAIERAWQGSGGWHKTLLQEVLPHYISRCVHLTFVGLFPNFKKLFSPRFVQNIYYNVIYMLSGVAPYQDFLDQTIVYYFGDKVELQLNSFSYFIATNQKLIGEHTDNEPTVLTNAFTTKYNIDLNKTMYNNQQFQMNYAMSLNNIQTISQTGENRGTGHNRTGQLEPITRDFNLIPGLGTPQVRYAVDQQTRRNFYTGVREHSETSGRVSPAKPPLIPGRSLSPGRTRSPSPLPVKTQDLRLSAYPTDIIQTQTMMKNTVNQSAATGKSVLAQMEEECRKVRRFQTPITDLQRLGELEKQRSIKRQTLNTQVQQTFSPRKKVIPSTAKVYELEPVMEPPTKYREMQRAILRTLGEAPQTTTSKATDDVLNKTGNSMIQNDIVIIRLPEEFRAHSLADTKVIDYIDQNPITNNDVVLNFQSEEFQTYVGDALKEAKGLLQTKKIVEKPKFPKTTTQHLSTPSAFSNELMEQIGANNEPAKLSAGHITLTTVTPLMALYLQVSDAPTPNNCFNLIDIEGQIDYGTFKSTFYKDKMSRLAGVPVNHGNSSPTRNLAVIQRSRNDCWLNGMENPEVSQLQSTRDFIGEYKADKKRIEQLTQLKTNKLKEELKQIYIEKQLFLDPTLLGQAERASALAKKLGEVEETVEETIQAQQLLNKVKKDLNKKLNLVEARIKIAENDARREESRRRVFRHPEKPAVSSSNAQTREVTKETNRIPTRTSSKAQIEQK